MDIAQVAEFLVDDRLYLGFDHSDTKKSKLHGAIGEIGFEQASTLGEALDSDLHSIDLGRQHERSLLLRIGGVDHEVD